MNNAHKPLTAFERSRLAYEEMTRRQYAAASERKLRAKSRNARFAIVYGAVIGLLIGCLIFYEFLPAPTRSREDAGFAVTRTGHVRSYVKDNTCQDLQFNNVSGGYVSGALVPCDVILRKEPAPPSGGDRINAIRDAFTR